MQARIIIVDDEPLARERLGDLLSDIHNQFPHHVLASFGNADELIVYAASHEFDIVFLDVQMPKLNGLELAHQINQLGKKPSIIFVTAFDGFALQAFDVDACDYLLKPVRSERLLIALQRAWERHQIGQDLHAKAIEDKTALTIMERGKITRIPIQEINYFKADQKYVVIYTDTQELLSELSLAHIEQSYPDVFLRIHRNTLVARKAVRSVRKTWDETGRGETWHVILVNQLGEEVKLKVSRRLWSHVKEWVRPNSLPE